VRRIVVLPDIHTPNEDYNSLTAVLKFIKYYKPTDLVQLGDLCDWDSVSSYDIRRERDVITIQEEVDASNYLLDRIEKVLPKGCKKHLTGGNHEARYERARVNSGHDVRIRQLKEFGTWYREYNLDKRGWEYVEYGEWITIGKMIFTHGWSCGPTAAQKHLNLFHKNIMFGHTHTFGVAIGSGLDGHPVLSATIGTLSRFDLSYLVGKPPVQWIHMFAYLDMMDDGTFTPHFVPIVNGRFFAEGREFNCLNT
jgi:hypothetical protein